MKYNSKYSLILALLYVALWSGCDTNSVEPDEPVRTSERGGGTTQTILAIEVGDEVETVSQTDVYERATTNSTVLSTLDAGEVGTVLAGPRTRNGDTWFRVDFNAGVIGYVTEGQIAEAGGDGGDGGGGGENSPPSASFTSSVSELTVDFSDTSSDSDGSVASWAWDFGDGATSTAQSPSHTYAAEGTYTVSLVVTDDDGDSDTATSSVTVSEDDDPPPPPPTGDFILGLAGCSLERETNDGYKLVSSPEEDELTWPRDATTYFSGGHISDWADNNDKIWNDWEAAYAQYGATVIHLMPCIRGPESGKSKARSEDVPWPVDNEVQQMRDWISNIEARAPGVPIYVSGQPDYEINHCETVGVNGPAAMDSLAKVVVAEGRALLGPTIGPLVNLPEGTPGDETRPLDECHPNQAGAAKIGNQFRDWVLSKAAGN